MIARSIFFTLKKESFGSKTSYFFFFKGSLNFTIFKLLSCINGTKSSQFLLNNLLNLNKLGSYFKGIKSKIFFALFFLIIFKHSLKT